MKHTDYYFGHFFSILQQIQFFHYFRGYKMNVKEFLSFVRRMYDENYAERWEAGQTPYKNEWEYLTKNVEWLEKRYYHYQAEQWESNKEEMDYSGAFESDIEDRAAAYAEMSL